MGTSTEYHKKWNCTTKVRFSNQDLSPIRTPRCFYHLLGSFFLSLRKGNLAIPCSWSFEENNHITSVQWSIFSPKYNSKYKYKYDSSMFNTRQSTGWSVQPEVTRPQCENIFFIFRSLPHRMLVLRVLSIFILRFSTVKLNGIQIEGGAESILTRKFCN